MAAEGWRIASSCRL